MWRFRGTPPYLGQQAKRLGISQVLADRARHNPEIHRVSVLLGQLCERAHRARKEDGRPVLSRSEIAQVRGTLEQIEQEVAKLHALAAASAEMLDEAWAAFDLGTPPRHFAVLCDYDTPGGRAENGERRTENIQSDPSSVLGSPLSALPIVPLPAGDGTVGSVVLSP